MKKILFGITSLTIGGAERVLVDLANKLVDEYNITIFTIYGKGELEKQLSKKVKVKTLYPYSYQELSLWKKKWIPFKLFLFKNFFYNKKIKQDYDVEVAFLEGAITRLFSIKNKMTKKIAWIHNDIGLVFGNGWKAKIKKYYDRKVYSKYNTLVFVSKDNQKSFEKTYPDLRNDYLMRVHQRVIYNYVDQENILNKAKEKVDITFQQPNFVEVARLTKQKAIDRLIKVHAGLIKEGYTHHFYIIGDGPERENLERLIQKEEVKETFHLLGKKENPYPYMKKADVVALLSYFEGYPMVIEEAKILDKEIMITDTAAREVVAGYQNNTIVENTEQGIEQGLKQRLKKKNLEAVEIIPYNNEKILKKVIKVLGE